MYRVAIRFLLLALALMSPASQGQIAEPAKPAVELAISGPQVVHRGDNLWFTATLTNRSGEVLAVPSPKGGNGWWYMGGPGWKIVDKSGKQLKFKPGTACLCDNPGGASFRDGDFVLLEPGAKIEYQHEAIGDPSDKFIFPRGGTFFASLSWSFCAPRVKTMDNGSLAYTCGVTRSLSQPLKDVLERSPSFEVQSNVWKISLK